MARKDYIIPLLALVCVLGLVMLGPVPQDQNYHNFADQRALFGIPNFLNVITNLPFALVALKGLGVVRKIHEKELKHISLTLFAGFLILTTGSGYYHWKPENITLVYDRIPIVIVIMSFLACIIYSINRTIGYKAFFILNIIGVFTVIYWIVSENAGRGDLRWYGMAQFSPIIAIPLMLILYKPSFNPSKEVILIFLFFGLARLTEMLDQQVYHFLNNIISGHSLKHLFMVAAAYEIVVLMRRRVKVLGIKEKEA